MRHARAISLDHIDPDEIRQGQQVRKKVEMGKSRPGCRIHLIQLPPYCPHLNPIERLWAVMHQHVTHNRHYPTQKQFADAILAFLRETIPNEWQNFRDPVSDNFRLITRQNFRVLAVRVYLMMSGRYRWVENLPRR